MNIPVILRLSLLVLIASLNLAGQEAEPSPRPSGQVVVGGILIDHDFAFEIRPQEDLQSFEVLEEQRSWPLSKKSIAGWIFEGRVGGFLIPLRKWPRGLGAKEGGLDDALTQLCRRMLPAGQKLEAAYSLELSGASVPIKARARWMTVATTTGKFLRSHEMLFERDGLLFWTRSYGLLNGALRDEDLSHFARSVRMRPGPIVIREKAKPIDAQVREGPGWQIENGVYESGSYGLRMRLSDEWRIEAGREFASKNFGFPVGLFRDAGAESILVEAQRVAESGIDAFAEEAWTKMLGGVPKSLKEKGPRKSPDAPHPLMTILQLDHPKTNLIRMFGALFRNEMGYRIHAGGPLRTREESLDRMGKAILQIEFLPAEERRTLIAREAAYSRSIPKHGPNSYFSAGVWRDFVVGVELTLPAEPAMEVLLGRQACGAAKSDEAVFACRPVGTEQFMEIRTRPFVGSLDRFEKEVRDQFDGESFELSSRTIPFVIDGVPARRILGRITESGKTQDICFLVAVRNGASLLVISGSSPDFRAVDARRFRDFLAGLKLRSAPPLRMESTDGYWIARDLGLRFSAAGLEGKPKRFPFSSSSGEFQALRILTPDGAVAAVAVKAKRGSFDRAEAVIRNVVFDTTANLKAGAKVEVAPLRPVMVGSRRGFHVNVRIDGAQHDLYAFEDRHRIYRVEVSGPKDSLKSLFRRLEWL